MQKQKVYYKIKSQGSSHKNEDGLFISGFTYDDEVFYTLKLHNEGFRSYPCRNLERQEPTMGKEMIDKFLKILREALLREVN